MTQKHRDIRKEVTDKIVAALEQGVMPWRCPWVCHDVGVGLPKNAVTDRLYNGGNRLILLSATLDKGFQDNRWLTFNQAKELGGTVMRGEHGTVIEYWEDRPFWKRKDVELFRGAEKVDIVHPENRHQKTVTLTNGERISVSEITVVHNGRAMDWHKANAELSVLISKAHVVFNVEQCNGLNIEKHNNVSVDKGFGKAESIVRAMAGDGVKIRTDGKMAYYKPSQDLVVIPPEKAFESHEAYLGTLLHELGHATGNTKRLGRNLSARFGSPEYAKEELVAELASAFVAAETGIGFDDRNHASYIESWLSVLKKDKHEIFRAAK